tara:strand:+ start:315 stop:755 length:441 start_codon:yes stop_codon:yes gene_type:complete
VEDTLIIISCGKRKYKGEHLAKDLYCAPMFKKSRAYAELNSKHWRILSAKYGVLHPDDKVHNYDHTIKDKTATELNNWNNKVSKQLQPFINWKITLLAPAAYCGWINNFKHVDMPLKGISLGFRNQWLYRQIQNHNQKTLWEKNTK